VPARLVLDRNTGVVVPPDVLLDDTPAAVAGRRREIDLRAGAVELVPTCRMIRSSGLPDGVEYGVDVYGWGSFDDVTADRRRSLPAQWVVRTQLDSSPLSIGRSGEASDDSLLVTSVGNIPASAHFVSRAPLVEHRWFDEQGHPLDAAPRYSLSLDVKRASGDDGRIDLDVYHVDDVDPTTDPVSTVLRRVELPLGAATVGEWQHIEIDIPPDAFAPGTNDLSADAVMVTFRVPAAIEQAFEFDDVRLFEWRARPAADVWLAADALRSDADTRFEVTVTGCIDR
jgi:hypothetical protein